MTKKQLIEMEAEVKSRAILVNTIDGIERLLAGYSRRKATYKTAVYTLWLSRVWKPGEPSDHGVSAHMDARTVEVVILPALKAQLKTLKAELAALPPKIEATL